MLHPALGELPLIVKLLVEPDDRPNIVLLKVVEDIAESLVDFGQVSRRSRCRPRVWFVPLLDGRSKCEEMGREEVPVAVLDLLVVLVLLQVELVELEQPVVDGAARAEDDVLQGEVKVGACIAGISKGLLRCGVVVSTPHPLRRGIRYCDTHELETSDRMQSISSCPSQDDHLSVQKRASVLSKCSREP